MTGRVAFDHLAVAAETLAEGAARVEEALGLPLAPGGRHALMGTHNRLLALGPREYLEVIAIDPDAPDPGRPRWFDLDSFSGPPRLTNWIARSDDLARTLALAPPGAGEETAFARGDLRWRMGVPADGRLPFSGAFPALIQWDGPHHATDLLPASGCRLRRLEIAHPDAEALAAALQPFLTDPRIAIFPGAEPALRAEVDTPHGLREVMP